MPTVAVVTDVDIAIVGGGPAGASLALFLSAADAKLAERVVVFDKARFPRDKICAGAIGGRGERALASVGVSVAVDAAVVRGLHVRSRERELTARYPCAIGRVVRRRAFDAALLNEVRARGVAVRDGVGVRGIVRRARGVTLHTDAGAVTAQAVIGADGVGSVVRRSLGWPRGAYYAQAIEIDTHAASSDPPRDVLSFDVSDRALPGYAWDFPTRVDGRDRVCRGIYMLTQGVDRPTVDIRARLLSRLSEIGAEPAGPLKRFAERGLSLYEPLAADRVLLVGEAAGIDPVLGEGIPQAILYAQAAAAYLARCVADGDFRFGGYRRAMRAARIGTDLRIRTPATHLVYGRMRPVIERWVTSSTALARAGMAYFAGERVPRGDLARAAVDLFAAAAHLTGATTR